MKRQFSYRSLIKASKAPMALFTWLVAVPLATFDAPAQALSPVVTNLWRIPAGQEYDFVGTNANNLVRGVGINPVNGNVIYATRDAGSNHLAVADAATGTVLRRLSGTGVSGGTLNLDQVKCADDGVIYAANLAVANGELKIYRWESDATANDPMVVFDATGASTRYGDTMDLRGAGASTQIIIAGSGGTKFALFTTSDGVNFNGHTAGSTADPMVEIPLPSGLAAGDIGKGIAFDGTNNAFYAKKDGSSSLRYVSYDPVALTATLVTSITVDTRLVGLGFLSTNGVKIVAGILYGSGAALQADQHRARFWNVTSAGAPQLFGDDPMPAPYAANGNAIGAADIRGNRIAVLEPNNGLACYRLALLANQPPAIAAQPVGSTNLLAGGYYTLTVSASGSGLKYQWFLGTNALANATNSSLALTNLTLAQAGSYSVSVSNPGGATTSAPALIGLIPSTLTAASAKLWQLTPGSRPYLTTDNTQRGLAYNPATGHLILASRTPTNGVHVLDAMTGNDLKSLDMSAIQPASSIAATFDIDMAAAGADGAVYVANLTTGGNGYTIYRWADENAGTVATVAYQGDPGVSRIGDTFGAAGAGAGTVLFAGSRNGTQVAVFTTADGLAFNSAVVDVTSAAPGFAGLGLYATATNEFWAKSSTFSLRKVQFDLAAGTNLVAGTFDAGTGTLNAIGVDAANQLAVGVASSQTPPNLALYDLYGLASPTATNSPPMIDQEFFGADNPNLNGTGAVAVDVAGGRIFALDTNNGLLALKYAPPIRWGKSGGSLVLTWYGPAVLERAATVDGAYEEVAGASSPYTVGVAGYYRLKR